MAGYIGAKAVGLNVTTGDILGDVGVGGVVTANAGVVVDNFTLDGTTLALSSGNLIIDSEAGDIILDAHGHDYILKTASSAELAVLGDNTSGDFFIRVGTQDKDIIFKGDDGGSAVTALTLDMSDAGAARFVNGTAALPAVSFISDSNTGMFRIGSDTLGFSTAGAQRLAIDSTGIKFHGDTATANALNDYEEGTFTPTFAYGTAGNSSFGYSAQYGHYVKVGDIVHFQTNVRLNAFSKGNASGSFFLAGLPYTAHNTGGYAHAQVSCSFLNWAWNADQVPTAAVIDNTTTVNINTMTSNTITAISDPDADAMCWVSGTYRAA